jgi:hypothetical protein
MTSARNAVKYFNIRMGFQQPTSRWKMEKTPKQTYFGVMV